MVLEPAGWLCRAALSMAEHPVGASNRSHLYRLTGHVPQLCLFNKRFKQKCVAECFALDGGSPKCADVLCKDQDFFLEELITGQIHEH